MAYLALACASLACLVRLMCTHTCLAYAPCGTLLLVRFALSRMQLGRLPIHLTRSSTRLAMHLVLIFACPTACLRQVSPNSTPAVLAWLMCLAGLAWHEMLGQASLGKVLGRACLSEVLGRVGLLPSWTGPYTIFAILTTCFSICE